MTSMTTAHRANALIFIADCPQLDMMEFALSEDEIAVAAILQFDPDATVSFASTTNRPDIEQSYFAIPGYQYSGSTWARLALGLFGGRPVDAFARFLDIRARPPG